MGPHFTGTPSPQARGTGASLCVYGISWCGPGIAPPGLDAPRGKLPQHREGKGTSPHLLFHLLTHRTRTQSMPAEGQDSAWWETAISKIREPLLHRLDVPMGTARH